MSERDTGALDTWTNGGGEAGDEGLEVQSNSNSTNNDRKRNRSSDSDSSRSTDSAETSQKKAKVANISFELSEKVSIPPLEKDVTEDQNSNNNSNMSDLSRKSVKSQVESLAAERGMVTDFQFIQPPGFIYKVGQSAPKAEYKVHLSLRKPDVKEPVQLFPGVGTSPYEAMREACKKAREYFTNLNGEFASHQSNGSVEDHKNNGNGEMKMNNIDPEINDKITGENEAKNDHIEDNDKDSDSSTDNEESRDRVDSRNEDIEEESEDDQREEEEDNMKHDWVGSLENFYGKALAPKLNDSVSINYKIKEQSEEEILVSCNIGKLSVEDGGETFEKARQSAAKFMLDTIETHLTSGSDIINMIVDVKPPFRDETAVPSDEDDDFEESNDKDDSKDIEEATIDSSDEETTAVAAVSAGPSTKHADTEAVSGEMQPGVEYAMALMRTDKPAEKPMLMDIANLGRRVRCGMAKMILSSLQDGERSDEEEEEEGRMLETFQEMLSLAGSLSDRSKMRLVDMFSRSSVGGVLRSMQGPLPGQGMYPVHPKHRLMSQYPQQPSAPAVPVEPPKPVIQPLKNLCQYPQGIEGVGSVTVSLDDYKTLAAGTFLNDVIIDFYLKYLQYTIFNDEDKNRTHTFTTFWFSRLTSKPSPIEARKDPVIRRHDRVKRWTRKVNIFEKDFVVVPINENYHWYLCIICYPGKVGCETSESGEKCDKPAKQRNRRKAKDKIKGIRSKMNALPRKDTNDERDEPLASEDEIEHEDDSIDVELWKNKFVEWEKQEVIRKAEEERRRQELERQRQEWEERRRQYEEEQRRLYEQRLQEQEELRRQMEEEANEDLGEEEEQNWDEDNLDEDGNPIEDSYDDTMLGVEGEMMCNEFGEPVEMVTTLPGMFSDAGTYKTSLDILGTAFESVKGQAMAADWDDWGDGMEVDEVNQQIAEDSIVQYPSMVSHMVSSFPDHKSKSSFVCHKVDGNSKFVEAPIEHSVNNEDEEFSQSFVAHSVNNQKSSQSVEVSRLIHNLEMLKSVLIEPQTEETIAQIDGMDDDSSDEDMEQDDDEHRVPDPEISHPGESDDNDHLDEDEDSIMSVEEVVTVGHMQRQLEEQDQANNDNDRRHDNSDSDTEPDEKRDEGNDDSSDNEDEENENFHDARSGNDENNEISNEGGESANYDSHEDSYASDFDDEVNERRRDSDESSTETEGLEQDDDKDNNVRDDVKEDGDTKDLALADQSDSEIEELAEVEVNNQKDRYDQDEDDEQEDDDDDKSSASDQSDSEFEEEDISNDVPVRQPCILVFDSLGGRKDRQARLCAVLRDFLTMEYQEKYPGQKREFSTRTIPGCAPKVPQQPNLTDCGIYVCHNVETFFKNPINDYTLPITSLKNWFPGSEPRVKRRDIATLIRKLATEQNQDKLEQLIFPENMVFMEPEKPKPVPAAPARSDGESDLEDDYISDEEYYSDENNDERRQKRYRSGSSSDEDRSPQRRRRNNESDEDDFDSGAVYGARVDPSPLRKLPPGISVSRSSEFAAPKTSEDDQESPRANYPTPLRKLPPGISISRQAVPASHQEPSVVPPHPPSPRRPPSPLLTPISGYRRPAPPSSSTREVTFTSVSSDGADHGDVTCEDVSDCSDENEIFDLDEPAHYRTYLSPNSFQALQDRQQELLERKQYIQSTTVEELNTSFSSMLAHQAAEAAIESCLVSMVTHQIFNHNIEEEQVDDTVPQIDGMEDFDSEEETREEAVESVPVNEDAATEEASVEQIPLEDVNQPEETGNIDVNVQEGFCLPETTEQHESAGDILEAASVEVSGEMLTEEIPLEYPAEDLNDQVAGNFPTEIAVEQLDQLEPDMMDPAVVNNEAGEEILEDNHPQAVMDQDILENISEDVTTSENIDVGFINSSDVNLMHAESIPEEQETAEAFDEESEQVDMEDMDNMESFVGYDDEEEYVSEYDEDDSRDQQEDTSRGQYQPPPEKRARMSSDAEVVLDSDDDDDGAPPAQQSSQPPPGSQQYASRGPMASMYNQYSQMMGAGAHQSFLAQQQAMMQQQLYQQQLMMQQQQLLQQQLKGRKRKLDSVALCIKDGRVYSKSFSQLPSFLTNNNKTEKQIPTQQQHNRQQQQVYQTSLNYQLQDLQNFPSNTGLNPYNPVQSYPYAALNTRTTNPHQPINTSNPLSSVEQIYQRLGQKPPGIVNDDVNSVEEDDYRSDDDLDDTEVMDGEEITNDDDISQVESYHSDDDDIQSAEEKENNDNHDNNVDMDDKDLPIEDESNQSPEAVSAPSEVPINAVNRSSAEISSEDSEDSNTTSTEDGPNEAIKVDEVAENELKTPACDSTLSEAGPAPTEVNQEEVNDPSVRMEAAAAAELESVGEGSAEMPIEDDLLVQEESQEGLSL